MLLLLLGVFAVCGILRLLFRQYFYWTIRGIPHITTVPFIGNNAPLFFRLVPFPKFIEQLYWRMPDSRYYGMMDMSTPSLIVRDPKLISEICVRNFDCFSDRRAFVNEKEDPIVGRNVLSLRGQRWKEVRNTLSPSFTSAKMKIMFQLVSKCSREFVTYFQEHPETMESIESKDAFTRYANDVIASAAFGISVNSLRDRSNEFYNHGKEATDFGSGWKILKFIFYRICPRLMRLAGVRFLPHKTNKFFTSVVADTVKTREEQKIVRPDMIHLMMQAKDKPGGMEVTVDDIIAQAFIFFLAGFDTSSTLMCFLAHELAVNPDVQKKLQDEVDSFVKEDDSDVSYELLASLKYMDMVINETLRKYPPTPLTDRICTKPFKLPAANSRSPELTVDVGTVLTIPIYAFHHDPKIFPDPETFDPERFSDENKDNIDCFTYMPFGIGPRKCIGNRFALMETKILFYYILRTFNLKLADKMVHPVTFSKKDFNMLPEGGFWIKFEERKKLN